uniref:Uncharacterized protein n=1 Tax=Oryza punctata TaxID=4537 RepID=A0A0E0KMK3_ORYPU
MGDMAVRSKLKAKMRSMYCVVALGLGLLLLSNPGNPQTAITITLRAPRLDFWSLPRSARISYIRDNSISITFHITMGCWGFLIWFQTMCSLAAG